MESGYFPTEIFAILGHFPLSSFWDNYRSLGRPDPGIAVDKFDSVFHQTALNFSDVGSVTGLNGAKNVDAR